MRLSARLEKLGFTVDQVVRCRTNSGGLVYIPARINDEAVQLVFANGRTYDGFLYESYAAEHGLPVIAEGENKYATLATLSVHDRTVTDTRVLVGGEYRWGTPPVAGFLCMKFFHAGVMAIDASVPAIAYTETRDALSLDAPVSRLKLDRNYVKFGDRWFVMAHQSSSSVTPESLGDKKPGRNGRTDLTLSLPGGAKVTELVQVQPSKFNVAGTLGADLWCRWITVFDFPANELLLFSYD